MKTFWMTVFREERPNHNLSFAGACFALESSNAYCFKKRIADVSPQRTRRGQILSHYQKASGPAWYEDLYNDSV
jgi:hypothetical protein